MQSQQAVAAASPAKSSLPMTCLGAVLNLVWIGLLAAGVYYGYGSWKLSTQGNRVTGTVVQMISSDDEDGVTYAPVVEYQADGSAYSYESHNYSNPPAYHVGQQVNLVYDRAHPDKARISNFLELWLVPLILIPFGFSTGFVTLLVLPAMMRRRRA